MKLQSILFFILTLSCLLNLSESVQFEIVPFIERCIRQEFKINTLVNGRVAVDRNDNMLMLNYKIMDNEMNVIFENKDISDNTFAFTSHKDEDYQFCFTDVTRAGSVSRGSPRIVTLEYSTVGPKKDYVQLAKLENLKPIEVELRKVEDLVNSIKVDFDYLKDRESRHRNTNESTNSRVAWLSFVSLLILVTLGVVQIYYLKRYFKTKKLI